MALSNKPVKFSLLIISIFIIFVISFAQFGLERLKGYTKESVREKLQTVLISNHKTIHIWIDQRKSDVTNLTRNVELVNLVSNLIYEHQGRIKPLYVSTVSQLKKYLSSEINVNSDVEFYVVSKNGRTVASNQGGQVGKINFLQTQAREDFNRVFKGESVFISLADSGDTYNYFIVSPILNQRGVSFAAIVVKIDPSIEFSSITNLGRLGVSGETYAFNKTGVLITETRFSNIAEVHINDSGNDTKDKVSFFDIKIASDSGENESGSRLKRAIEGDASFYIDDYRNYRGANVMGAWLWDDELGFGLATEIVFSEGMQSYHEIKNIIIIVLCLTALLSIILFVLIQISQKDSERKLKKAYALLEQRVIERTKELQGAKDNLVKVNKELETLSTIDGLTDVFNRRYFDLHLDKEWKHCVRDEKSITIIMFDIDCFKNYNDTYGHQKGDECLKAIGHMLKTSGLANRPGDLVARYGGEEFIILLVDASIKYAAYISNKVRNCIRELKIPHETSIVSDDFKFVTVSLGYARLINEGNYSPADLIKFADEALYLAKAQGRDCVIDYFSGKEVSEVAVI
ncbi:MAG: GGDEF domain-containing protein [Proteobacteria bacterium]|nr:GGDEF domain-containing protein [Pseudomonadota bacterium]NOG59965.1 GGDEF domain-containing protein [Pseudomonadota bacterium]